MRSPVLHVVCTPGACVLIAIYLASLSSTIFSGGRFKSPPHTYGHVYWSKYAWTWSKVVRVSYSLPMLGIAGDNVQGVAPIVPLPRLSAQSDFDRSPVKSLLRDMLVFLKVEFVSNQYGDPSRCMPPFAIPSRNCSLGWSEARYNIWASFHIFCTDF